MLKQTEESPDKGLVLDLGGQNQLVNLGSFKDLIYHHREELPLKWSIIGNGGGIYKFRPSKIQFDYIVEESAEVIYDNKQMKFLKHQYLVKSAGITGISSGRTKAIKERNKKASEAPYTEERKIDEQNKMRRSIYYLAPLREYPKREYQWSGASPSHVGYRGENTINAILAATIRNETRIIPELNEEKPFQEVIAYWLKKLHLIHEFKLKEIAEGTGLFHAIVKKEPESTEVFLTDVGFGVSQVLPALVLLYYVPEGSIILMEQPEIHLHPSVQSGLADVILQVSKQRNIQVIVESHSEHLLQRFQRRVAEESYPVEELKLYFCDSQQGESKLMDLEIDEFGDIKNYPDNFFGDEMAEMAATHKAALKRKIQAQTK
jgi:predicted ATPase